MVGPSGRDGGWVCSLHLQLRPVSGLGTLEKTGTYLPDICPATLRAGVTHQSRCALLLGPDGPQPLPT